MKILPLLFLVGLAGADRFASAANQPGSASMAPDLSGSLRETVAALAEKEKRRATDYAQMAEETITFGSNPESVSQLNGKMPDAQDPQGPWRHMVNDALSGVDEGERLDPKAADWESLREKLKQMQPPPPPPGEGGSKKDKKDQKKDKKQQKGSGKDKQPQSGGGQKSEEQEGGEGEQGEGESEGSPSEGQPGKGKQKGGQEGGEENDSGEGGGQGQEQQARGKDPNEIRDFSNRKDGEGEMKQRGRNEDMKGMEDEKAGFGSLGEKKDQGKEKSESGGVGVAKDGEKGEPAAPTGMRVVGGGTGQKGSEKTSDPLTLEALSRLDQVKQSDSPAVLQQRLQPQDQRPQPSSLGKPW